MPRPKLRCDQIEVLNRFHENRAANNQGSLNETADSDTIGLCHELSRDAIDDRLVRHFGRSAEELGLDEDVWNGFNSVAQFIASLEDEHLIPE